MFKPFVYLIIGIYCSFFIGCGKKEGCRDPNAVNYDPDAEAESGSCVYPLNLTQAGLDASNTLAQARLTGAFLNLSLAHNGTPQNGEATIRDIFMNQMPNEVIQPGTIFTKRVYEKDSLGNYGKLLMTFAMLKQPVGYYTAGGDYEYVVMPYDSTVNYTLHPNGILPASNTAMRGKMAFCANCHSNAGTDYVFSR